MEAAHPAAPITVAPAAPAPLHCDAGGADSPASDAGDAPSAITTGGPAIRASLVLVEIYTVPKRRRTRTSSPWPLAPRAALGTAMIVRPDFSRHTLVLQAWPSTTASTGVRPKAYATDGAYSSGSVTKCHPPGEYSQRLAENSASYDTGLARHGTRTGCAHVAEICALASESTTTPRTKRTRPTAAPHSCSRS